MPPSGSRVAALVILVFFAAIVAGYFIVTTNKKTDVPPQKKRVVDAKPVFPSLSANTDTGIKKTEAIPPHPPVYKADGDYAPLIVTPKNNIPNPVFSGNPKLAIIIDDMGSSIFQAKSLAAIKVPLTFAIIPGLRFDKEVAVYAASQQIDMIIHIPMQSKGWPGQRLESNGLLVSMDSGEIGGRVFDYILRFPEAIGVNNHMGSEFTEHEDKMTAVMKVLKNKNLFFVDSVTSSESVGLKAAAEAGVKAVRRNVFLDNEQEQQYILGQLNQAVKTARKNGRAIAIGHPHPATIAALAYALPGLAGKGIEIVPVAQFIK
ncbi:MAG: divergent polysaccharide deacetylase family protein [Desulfuromonadaceae bacterium]|nr:divergent polysaccharide deacetylase family protein [Desulfuromonadaceae bacterium]MDD2855775.1 divergent polysaccharide deacetylase family protein [Desulfuromonadaceae bacterium]